MAKQVLKVTDFTGGVNSLSDARDIGDTQFAQNWNAALDKTGIVRYSGGGIQSIFNLPQDNTNQFNGFGLFRFTTDYSFNILDSDLNVGIEIGNILLPIVLDLADAFKGLLDDFKRKYWKDSASP